MKFHYHHSSLKSQYLHILIVTQEGYVSGDTPFEDSQLDSAKSGIMYQLISKEETICSATMQVCFYKTQSYLPLHLDIAICFFNYEPFLTFFIIIIVLIVY